MAFMVEERCLLECFHGGVTKDGDDTFSEKFVRTTATLYKVPESIYNNKYGC
jgi:hypothetical protein